MPIRAVFFDFAGTLFSDRALRDAHLAQLRLVADTVGVEASDEDLRAAYRGGMGVAYRAIATQPSYLHRDLFGAAFAAMAEALGGRLDAGQVSDVVDRQYRATIDHAALRPDCLETLVALRADGLFVQIVSNIDVEQIDGLMQRMQLAPALDAWTSSEEAGSCKPDPAIYDLALSKSGCDADHVLFVGDSPAHDIDGPRAAGMRTALLVAESRSTTEGSSADHVIGNLGEVLAIVGGDR